MSSQQDTKEHTTTKDNMSSKQDAKRAHYYKRQQ